MKALLKLLDRLLVGRELFFLHAVGWISLPHFHIYRLMGFCGGCNGRYVREKEREGVYEIDGMG